MRSSSYIRGRPDRVRCAIRPAACGALAFRACAGGDPGEPVARHVPGLPRRALQAGRISSSRRRDGTRRRADGIPALPRLGRGTSVVFSGELLAMVVIGGMHHILVQPSAFSSTSCSANCFPSGPPIGCSGSAWFSSLRDLFARRTDRHLGQTAAPLAAAAGGSGGDERAQGLRRPAAAGIPSSRRAAGVVLEVDAVVEALRRHPRRDECEPWRSVPVNFTRSSARMVRARPPCSIWYRACSSGRGPRAPLRREIQGLPPDRICPQVWRARSRSRIVSQPDHLRESAPVAARRGTRAGSTCGGTSTAFRTFTRKPWSWSGSSASKALEQIHGGDLSYGGQRLVDLGIALGSKPQMLLLDEPLAGLAAAEREARVEP